MASWEKFSRKLPLAVFTTLISDDQLLGRRKAGVFSKEMSVHLFYFFILSTSPHEGF